jgi:apolipoprotein N-acyltransferase
MNFLIALLVGAASAFAFQPFGLWPLMPLAFAILCELIMRAPRLRSALAIGWGFAVGQFCVGLNWIATAFTYQAAMPAWLGWIAVVLLSFYLAAFMMLATGLAWRFGRARRVALVLALAGAWAICEYLRGTLFTGFAWNPVGVALVDTPWRLASRAIGTYGLSALVVLVGGTLWCWSKRDAFGSIPSLLLVLFALLLALAAPSAPPSTPRAVRVVQPNIPQEEKWREGLADEAFRRLARLSADHGTSPRLLLWPEVAVPEAFQVLGQDQRPLAVPLPAIPRAVRSVRPGDLLLTGAFAVIVDRSGTVVGNTNSVFALGAGGEVFGRYDKAHLVPYGEYLPMRPLLSAIGLSQLAPGQGDTSNGPGPRTMALPRGWGKVGLQVCYEIIFSGEVVDRANRPDFLFNPSNDAWFGRWGPPQHLAQARLRAAEEGIPVIRSTPTGISAVVDARGDLLNALAWRTAGVIDTNLPAPLPGVGPFARLGNVIPISLGFLLVLAAIALDRRPRYRKT